MSEVSVLRIHVKMLADECMVYFAVSLDYFPRNTVLSANYCQRGIVDPRRPRLFRALARSARLPQSQTDAKSPTK